jgi:ribose 5-phosphate isomerase B
MKWYAGADHAGFTLKNRLVQVLRGLGDEVVDVGTQSTDSVDYPDYAAAVAHGVAESPGARGLLVCGTGIGMSISANKVVGVRAAVVTDAFTAQAAREHNDANVIAIGERVTGPGVAEMALRAFRDTAFAGGRHQKRVDKIAQLEAMPPDALDEK